MWNIQTGDQENTISNDRNVAMGFVCSVVANDAMNHPNRA
jgi:hypothetical protein